MKSTDIQSFVSRKAKENLVEEFEDEAKLDEKLRAMVKMKAEVRR